MYEIFLALEASPIWVACRRSTRCLEVFEPSAFQAMPCLGGFRIWGTNRRGILHHGLPAAMLLNLLGVRVGGW